MTVKDYKEVFENLLPVKVTYNKFVMFNDDNIKLTDDEYKKMLEQYDKFLNSDLEVKSFNVTVVHFHHTILEIKG